MADKRNFRSNYYEKVGFQGIEEKKTIEILLKDHPLDIEKLRQFCQRFSVSAKYRLYLWKVILGVLPCNQESHDFVKKQRLEQYNLLVHALKILRRIDDDTPTGEVFLRMYLVEEGLLPFEERGMLRLPGNRAYLSIATAVCNMVENPVDGYWITNKFYRYFNKYRDTLQLLPEHTENCLKKEDANQRLWNHFKKLDVWNYLPLSDWFCCCFAGILPDSSFERVLDKVIGGSCVILAYVAVAIFLTFKRPLLSMNSKEEMLSYLSKIPEDSGDILFGKVIDLWQKYGHVLGKTKSDSPNPVEKSPP